MEKKKLGFWSVFGLVIGAQLGSGIIMLPSQLSPYGIWGIIGSIITGIGAITIALVFGILSSYFPQTGGPHAFIREAFGKRASFYTAWSYWFIAWLSTIPVIVLSIGSLEIIFGPWDNWTRVLLQTSALFCLLSINLKGLQASGTLGIIFGILRILPLICIPLISFFNWNPSYIKIPTTISPLKALNITSLLMLWGFIGIEAGTTPGANVSDAKHTIPRALFWGTLSVMLIYIFNISAIMGVLPPAVLSCSFSPYADTLHHIIGKNAGIFASLLIFIICLGGVNSWIFASSQIAFGAAKEHLFPVFFSKQNKNKSPSYSMITTTVLLVSCIFLLQNHSFKEQLELLVEFSSVAFLMLYFSCTIALLKLLINKKIPSSLYHCLLTSAGLFFCVWSLIYANKMHLIGALAIPILGFFVAKFLKWPVS